MAISKSQILTAKWIPAQQHLRYILNCVKHKWIMINCLIVCLVYVIGILNRKLSKWTSAGPDLGSNDGLTTGTRRILTVSN